MSTQEATTQAASPKKAKASKKAVMTTTARKAKNAAEAHKANGSRSGSKAERVLELMKRREGRRDAG